MKPKNQLVYILLMPAVFFVVAAGTVLTLETLKVGQDGKATNVGQQTGMNSTTSSAEASSVLKNGQDEPVTQGGADPEGIYGGRIGQLLSQTEGNYKVVNGTLSITDAEGKKTSVEGPEDLTKFELLPALGGVVLLRDVDVRAGVSMRFYDAATPLSLMFYDAASKKISRISDPPDWKPTSASPMSLRIGLPSISEPKLYLQYSAYDGKAITDAAVKANASEFPGLGNGQDRVWPVASYAAILDLSDGTYVSRSPMFAGMGLERYMTNDLRLEWDSAKQVAMGPMDQNDCDAWNMLLRVDLGTKQITEIGGNDSFDFPYDPDNGTSCVPAVSVSPDTRWFLLVGGNKNRGVTFLLFDTSSAQPVKSAVVSWSTDQVSSFGWDMTGPVPKLNISRRAATNGPHTTETVEFK